MRRAIILGVGAIFVAGVFGCNRDTALGEERGKNPSPSGVPAGAPNDDASNTRRNQRDQGQTSDTAPTPGNQGESDRDLGITQQIRKSVVSDDALSLGAKNVKIITQGGRVTLRGPVRDEQEKRLIEQKASAIVGAGQVDDQLEVDTKNAK